MSIEFSTWHLVIGDKRPSAEGLKQVYDIAKENYTDKDTYYLISNENQNDKFFWLYTRYGKSLPYSNTVYNTKVESVENNPRSTHQIEPYRQFFALYCIQTQTLYLSSSKKKSWFEGYLNTKLNQDVVIKAFYNNVDEFIQKIKSVEKVKLVVKRNLISSDVEFMEIIANPKDFYGLGIPNDFTLEANFTNAKLTKAFTSILNKMVIWKNRNEADSLLCIGRDDKNFETIFKADSFIQKINVEANKDDQGLYNPSNVKQALIKKIEGNYEEKT